MEDKEKPVEVRFFKRLFKSFKAKPKVKKGYYGVYHYTLAMYANTEAIHNVKYDIFVKVKALYVYDDLVEVEVVGEPTITESITPEFASIIRNSVPKYLDPKKVKWQIEHN